MSLKISMRYASLGFTSLYVLGKKYWATILMNIQSFYYKIIHSFVYLLFASQPLT